MPLVAAAAAALLARTATAAADDWLLRTDVPDYADYAGAPPPPPPSPQLLKLEQQYGALQNATCAKVLPHIPVLPAADADKFMQAYASYNGTGAPATEAPVLKLAEALLSRSDVQKFLTLPDSFSQSGGLDAAMVQCAVMSEATPAGLAEFAVQGKAEEGLVTKLLNDPLLMRDMLVAGGATSGKYGEAMSIWTKLQSASDMLSGDTMNADPVFWDDRSPATVLRRLALGVAVEHALPIAAKTPVGTNIDAVERYLHYERAYKAGDLDPAVESLTAFECRYFSDSDGANEDLTWARQTLANFKPSDIAESIGGRYVSSVHGEVAYGHPQCPPGVCTGHYWQIPASGGECGPRAFWGRFIRKAWGLPTFGFTFPGHAAMSLWTPDGWHTNLGPDWKFGYWEHRPFPSGGRGGCDFRMETQVREVRGEFQKALRGGWAAAARGDAPIDHRWTTGGKNGPAGYGKGGLWSALMLCFQKVTAQTPQLPRPIPNSTVATKVDALLARWTQTYPVPNITTGADGTITIPAVAYTTKNRSASLSVQKSYDEGEQLLHGHGDLVDPAASSFGYEVTADKAGTFYLTVNFTTYHMNQDLMVATGASGKPQQVPVYYTIGYWNETDPIPIKLAQGKNVLTFTRSSDRDMALKEIFLYKNKPSLPMPPGNFTPAPTTPGDDFIEESASTTCALQGITPVTEEDCGRACAFLGLTYTGPKARPTPSGCFALTSGQYAGNCNYNSNKSAACTHPPCTLYGCTVQELCYRK